MVKLVRVTTIPVTPTMTTIFAMFLKSNIDTHPHKNRSLFLLRMQRKKRHLHPMISWRENHQNVRVGIDTSNYNFVTTTMRTRTMLRYNCCIQCNLNYCNCNVAKPGNSDDQETNSIVDCHLSCFVSSEFQVESIPAF